MPNLYSHFLSLSVSADIYNSFQIYFNFNSLVNNNNTAAMVT